MKAQHSSEHKPAAEPATARRPNFIQNVAAGDEHVAVEKAVDTYMGYLTGLKQVGAREEAAVTKSVETYCPILLRHSQMDPESRKVSDAAFLYTRYLPSQAESSVGLSVRILWTVRSRPHRRRLQ